MVLIAFAKANTACMEDDREERIANIQVDVELVPFHQQFSQSKSSDLPKLKSDYPRLFPANVPDAVWQAKLDGKDTIYTMLEDKVAEKAPALNFIENNVIDIYKHVLFYFPEFEPLDIITIISEVDYRYQVTATPEYLVIALDTYLGSDEEIYQGIYPYISQTLDEKYLPADVSMEIAELFVKPDRGRQFIEQMIYHGKLHYLQSLFVPDALDYQLLAVEEEKMKFAKASEKQIWRYFIDKQLLYSTDARLQNRFIRPAPFSKFYLELDRKTPGGIGKYIGLQIVRSFMENNAVTLDEMLTLPADEIFKNSNYRPQSNG